jgi:cytochrome c551/c552
MMPILKEFGDFVGEQIQKVATWVNGDGQGLMTFLGQIASAIQTGLMVALKTLFDLYQRYLQPALEWLLSKASVQGAMKTIAEYLGKVWEWLEKLFSSGDALAKLLKGDVQGAMDAWKTVIGQTGTSISQELNPALDDANTKTGNLGTAAANAKTPLDNLATSADNLGTGFGNANTQAGNLLSTIQQINSTPIQVNQPTIAVSGPTAGTNLNPTSSNATPEELTASQNWGKAVAAGKGGNTGAAAGDPGVSIDPGYTGPTMVKHADGTTWWHYPDGREVPIVGTPQKSSGSSKDYQKTGKINAYRLGETTLIINNPKGETPSQTYRNVRQQQRRLGAAAGVIG